MKMMINEVHPDSRPIRNPAYALQKDKQGWTALVNLDSACGVALNETGLLVWKTIDGTRTVAEIILEIKDQFSDTPPTIDEDMMAILEVLQDAGLIGFEVNV